MRCITSELSSPNLSFPHPPSIYGPCKVHSNWAHLQLATHGQDLSHYLPSPMAHLCDPSVMSSNQNLCSTQLCGFLLMPPTKSTIWASAVGYSIVPIPGTPQKPHSNSRWCQRWKRSSYGLCAPYEASSYRPPPHSPSTHPAWGCGQVMLVRAKSGFLSARTSPYPTVVMSWGI